MIGTLRMYIGTTWGVASLPIGLLMPMSHELAAVTLLSGIGGVFVGAWGVTAREIEAARLEAAQKVRAAQAVEFERYWTEWGTRADQTRLADATEKLCNPKPVFVGMYDEFESFVAVSR